MLSYPKYRVVREVRLQKAQSGSAVKRLLWIRRSVNLKQASKMPRGRLVRRCASMWSSVRLDKLEKNTRRKAR